MCITRDNGTYGVDMVVSDYPLLYDIYFVSTEKTNTHASCVRYIKLSNQPTTE
jgi:hypothetical protein